MDAWTDEAVAITHKMDYGNASESWSPVTLSSLNSGVLAGGDLFAGDIGVSGQNRPTSTVKQEIDGAQALRFDLDNAATKVTVDLSRFYLDDDGMALNYNEAGRLQALDALGNVVAEATFMAGRANGTQQVELEHAEGFSAVVVTAGAYVGDTFIAGAYADDAGNAVPNQYGSDFMIHAVEFEFPPLIGVAPADPLHG
jgi:hypothetical protein